MSTLSVQSLSFAYTADRVFNFPDITLESGKDLLILGESGIGKTTFLHLIAGLLLPKSGSVTLMGTSLSGLSSGQRDLFRGKHIGMVFQRPHFIKALALHEHLTLIQHLAGKAKDLKKIKKVLDELNIAQHFYAKPHRMSQGEQQRASIALAVINNPQLILADEPTASLDDKNCLKVAELLKEQAKTTGAMLAVITHDQRLKTSFSNTLQL